MIPVLAIPVLNRFDLLEQVLDSINYPIENILIIDNSGSYKTNRQNVHVINMPSNIGVAASWNLAIKSFPHASYWLIGSNDTKFIDESLKNFYNQSSSDKLILSLQLWNTFSIGAEIVKKIGLFDENYYPAYHEDTDYMERMRLNGIKENLIYSNIPMESFGASTTMHSNLKYFEKNKITGENNRKYYMNKIYGEENNYNCYNWDLQRRIDNDWDKQ
jgi:GT2 family glycosyltransferase